MGTWGTGPLDNDAAADWCAELDDAVPDQRLTLVDLALAAVTERGASAYLDSEPALEAVAAAVVVASLLPDGAPTDSTDALAFLEGDGIIAPSADLARLALRALDRVDGANSELPGLWGDDYARVLRDRLPFRAALQRATADGQAATAEPKRAGQAKPQPARRRVQFTPGSVLLVPAGAHRALAVMTARAPFIAFYGCDHDPEPAEIPALCAGQPLFVIGVDRAAYTAGRWGAVLCRRPQQDLPAIPPIFHQDILNGACSIIEPGVSTRLLVPREECVGLERQASWSEEHVESRLIDHYEGRPNVWAEAMRVRL